MFRVSCISWTWQGRIHTAALLGRDSEACSFRVPHGSELHSGSRVRDGRFATLRAEGGTKRSLYLRIRPQVQTLLRGKLMRSLDVSGGSKALESPLVPLPHGSRPSVAVRGLNPIATDPPSHRARVRRASWIEDARKTRDSKDLHGARRNQSPPRLRTSRVDEEHSTPFTFA